MTEAHTHGRFQKYGIPTEIFGVIDCRHDGRTVPECIPNALCCIFSWFYMSLTFQPCICIYDWLLIHYRLICACPPELGAEILPTCCQALGVLARCLGFWRQLSPPNVQMVTVTTLRFRQRSTSFAFLCFVPFPVFVSFLFFSSFPLLLCLSNLKVKSKTIMTLFHLLSGK